MMTRSVKVKLHTVIHYDDQPTVMNRQTIDGEWIQKGTSDYLRYDEVTENDQVIPTTVKIEKGKERMTIIRRGDVRMRLPLEARRETSFIYQVGAMRLPLIARVERVRMDGSESEHVVEAHYVLATEDGETLGKHELTITYTEEKK